MPAFLDDQPRTLAQLLAIRATERPHQVAFSFHNDDGQSTVWTYQELDARARRVAGEVASRARLGSRIVLVYPPGLEFIAGFFGCLYAGMTPVPATYPRPKRASSRLDAIAADCMPSAALTSSVAHQHLQLDQQSPAVQSLQWIATDVLEASGPALDKPADGAEDVLTLLQYTSGSTSQPRGVMVSHANMMANLEMIREGFGMPRADEGATPPVGAFWLPAYHDMGLIGGFLTPIYVGGTSHLLAPASFLRRPLDWLRLISEVRATISGGPNFGYQLCVEKIASSALCTLDLSAWRLAFCGAEPIEVQTLSKFAAAFAAAGFRNDAFYPCYGLAEATVMATGGNGPGPLRVVHADREQLSASRVVAVSDERAADDRCSVQLVGCGGPLGGQEVVIVDPQTCEVRAAGEIGEVWLRGPSIAQGYYNAPEESRETFAARLADGRGPYLRTGDLGCWVDDQLIVTGRLKDLIIVRGRNHYPQDIERTCQQAHEGVDTGAAFEVDEGAGTALVVVHQLHREHRRADLDAVCRAIRAAIIDEHEIDPQAIVLLRPGSLPRTSSGKVQRSLCREHFLSGQLSEEHRWNNPAQRDGRSAAAPSDMGPITPPRLTGVEGQKLSDVATEIERWMLDWLAGRLQSDRSAMTADAQFAELGIDSLTAIELIHGVETTIGVQISPADAWDFSTPAALSLHLAEQLQSAAIGAKC